MLFHWGICKSAYLKVPFHLPAILMEKQPVSFNVWFSYLNPLYLEYEPPSRIHWAGKVENENVKKHNKFQTCNKNCFARSVWSTCISKVFEWLMNSKTSSLLESCYSVSLSLVYTHFPSLLFADVENKWRVVFATEMWNSFHSCMK